MSNFRYDNVADAYQQLNRTVLFTNMGIPFYVRAVDQRKWGWLVLALGDREENTEAIDLRLLGIDFKPPQLGYCNYQGSCVYLVRRPVRMWKQGLSMEHLLAKHGGYIDEDILQSEYLYNTLLNNYPSLSESYISILDTGNSIAFHRDFALSARNYPNISLDYKGKVIGSVNEDGDLEIDGKFFYLKEQLAEVLHEESQKYIL